MRRLIDADALKAYFFRPYSNEESYSNTEIANVIDAQPTIEERKTGKWIHILTEADGNALYECSECHKGEVHVPIVEVKYCWNCGAKMEGSEACE